MSFFGNFTVCVTKQYEEKKLKAKKFCSRDDLQPHLHNYGETGNSVAPSNSTRNNHSKRWILQSQLKLGLCTIYWEHFFAGNSCVLAGTKISFNKDLKDFKMSSYFWNPLTGLFLLGPCLKNDKQNKLQSHLNKNEWKGISTFHLTRRVAEKENCTRTRSLMQHQQ